MFGHRQDVSTRHRYAKMPSEYETRPKRTENPKSFKYIPQWMDDASVQEFYGILLGISFD